MYDSGENAVDIGLGNISAEQEASKRKKQLSLSMAERLQMQSEESKFMGETKRLKVRGQGTLKEVSFIPKGPRKKKEEEESKFMGETKRLKVRGQGTLKEVSFIPKGPRKKKEEEASQQPKDDNMGRSRRGIKDLGFRTPFKHHK
jgi:hypothetical protein